MVGWSMSIEMVGHWSDDWLVEAVCAVLGGVWRTCREAPGAARRQHLLQLLLPGLCQAQEGDHRPNRGTRVRKVLLALHDVDVRGGEGLKPELQEYRVHAAEDLRTPTDRQGWQGRCEGCRVRFPAGCLCAVLSFQGLKQLGPKDTSRPSVEDSD